MLAGAAFVALVASAIHYATAYGWVNLFIEGSWAELVQLFGWIGAACWAWWRIPRTPLGRDRWMIFWLAILASLAAAREEDLQKQLNPDRFGPLGVSFRIDWWLDGSVPLALKIAWIILGAAIIFALTVPLLRARPRLILLTLGLDPATWLFGCGGAFLALGYAADDLFGRGLVMPLVWSGILEETSELLGAALLIASIVVAGRGSLNEREARAQRVWSRIRTRRAPA